MKLTPKQKIFVDEYLVDLNATRAYKAAYPSCKKEETINAAASRLLRNVKVKNYIDQRMKDREKRTEITQDMVLQRWWDIANADPNEIVHVRRVCCRHCFGKDHQYQWRDEEEYQQAVQMAIITAKEQGKEPIIPADAGGYDFDRLLRPHPRCPYCRGEGHAETHIEDTRHLSPEAKLLYAGVKQTATGVEIKFRDQDKALENVARHLGMFKDKVELTGEMGVKIIDDIGSDGDEGS
ncbi:terminase small subunit [Geosporobacter ferrireducens]|uniref:terminase small subunit n=1 Tax=Geosporobacter ferrireducens TaxID=1424294 RepID=UPI00139BC2A2|nr:terminase small subunit [Geosporobacter ferrireducens]MTI56143.1 terminase small subunit [Geosporobacter ferrireducens]